MNNDLIEQFIPLAIKLAYQRKRTVPNFIDIEDLLSAAYLGLVEAASRFNPNLGIKFSTFAYPRIFGAICDFLRQEDYNDIFFIEEKHTYCDNNLEEIFECLTFDFTEKDKKIVRNYFIDNFSLKEIGEKEHLTEGRISQLIKKYKEKMSQNYKNLVS